MPPSLCKLSISATKMYMITFRAHPTGKKHARHEWQIEYNTGKYEFLIVQFIVQPHQ